MEIKFSSDTKYRKEWLTGLHFAHPAKMHLSLQLWLIDRYTKEGEVILDPMAGSGTILVACSTGRNVIANDLEDKFIKMMDGNWKKIQQRGPQLGYKMGWAKILQGDARKLPDVLADVVITSPPYAESVSVNQGGEREAHQEKRAARLEKAGFNPKDYQGGHGRNLQQDWTYGNSEDNIGNLPYGKLADVIMTSPPYASTKSIQDFEFMAKQAEDYPERLKKGLIKGHARGARAEKSWLDKTAEGQIEDDNNLGNLPYGNIDCVITSPPYEEGGGHSRGQRTDIITEKAIYTKGAGMYSENKENIGEMRGDSYLSAMLEVYQGCWRVLKPQGLMCLVTKNFIRNKQEIRLDLDTIKLCEQSGFELFERHYRRLTSQSFWRTIYQQKYPDAPILDKEDILVFQK